LGVGAATSPSHNNEDDDSDEESELSNYSPNDDIRGFFQK
jgi:hypothetical protein